MDAKPKRRSIRLQGYDYSRSGAYFASICTKDQKCLFGDIQNREMVLNDAGWMVVTIWNELSHRFSNIELVEYIIMPNHIHGIISIVGAPGGRSTTPEIDSQKRADTRPAPTWHKANCFVARGFIPAKPCAKKIQFQ